MLRTRLGSRICPQFRGLRGIRSARTDRSRSRSWLHKTGEQHRRERIVPENAGSPGLRSPRGPRTVSRLPPNCAAPGARIVCRTGQGQASRTVDGRSDAPARRGSRLPPKHRRGRQPRCSQILEDSPRCEPTFVPEPVSPSGYATPLGGDPLGPRSGRRPRG